MSNQQLGTVVGAVIGYFVPVIGIPLGAAIGGAIGGLLTPPEKTQGPRLQDLKVSVSQYGAGIPTTFGNNVPPTTWVWSTDIIEVPQTSSTGKGGGVENTTYFNMIHGLIVLGTSPESGSSVAIRRLWKDGELVFDASVDMSVGQALASEQNPYVGLEVFDGNESQLPPAFIEIYEGIGNVPAFRGLITLLVVGLECPGGRVPQLSAELCIGSSLVTQTKIYGLAEGGGTESKAMISHGEILQANHFPGADSPQLRLTAINATGSTISLPSGSFVLQEANVHWSIVPVQGAERFQAIHPYSVSGAKFTFDLVDFETGTQSVLKEGITSDPWVMQNADVAVWDGVDSFLLRDSSLNAVILPSGTVVALPSTLRGAGFQAGIIYAVTFSAGHLSLVQMDQAGTVLSTLVNPTSMSDGPSAVRVLTSDGNVFVVSIAQDGAGKRPIWKVGATWDVLTPDSGVDFGTPRRASAFCNENYALIGAANNGTAPGQVSYQMVRFNVIAPAVAQVADIIDYQNRRAGLTVGQYDLSTIDDTVYGYTTVNPASSRANCAPLLTAYAIGSAEEDALIRYFKRVDKSTVVIIPYEELAQAEEGQDPGDPFPVTRGQELECPRSLTVTYLNPDFDYQQSTETAKRIVTDSELDEQVELAVAMFPDQAATIARRLLFERWVMQMARGCNVSRKYSFLSPGDVFTPEYPKGIFSNWMALKVSDTGTRIEIECIPADAELLTQTVAGSGGFRGSELTPLAPPTQMAIVDGPQLTDAGNNAGPYIALDGATDDWQGAEVFIGDDDSNLESRGAVSAPAPIGFAETVPGEWLLNVVDETNLITVSVGNDELTNTTRALLLAGTVNSFALGINGRWEIAQFERADSLGSGRFILSGLRRGLRGTERNTGNHAIGDTFVLLVPAGMLKPSMEAGAIGQPKSYRAITKGRSLDSAPSRVYAGTGESLKPFSPVDLRKSLSGSNIVFTWHRRTRMSENVLAGIFPLGESSERYLFELFTDNTFSTLVRSFSVNSESATYTSAMQSTDGYSGGSLFAQVVQISDQVGRGHELRKEF